MMTTRRMVTGALMLATLLSACAHTTAATTTAKNEAPYSQPATTAPAPAPAAPAVVQPAAPSFQDAFFDYDSSLIRADAKPLLERDAELLKNRPGMTATVGGYCDERGTDEYNLALGNRRAEAVKRYLVALGVEPARLKTVSYGKEKPFCAERTDACYQQNRRGHFLTSAGGI